MLVHAANMDFTEANYLLKKYSDDVEKITLSETFEDDDLSKVVEFRLFQAILHYMHVYQPWENEYASWPAQELG